MVCKFCGADLEVFRNDSKAEDCNVRRVSCKECDTQFYTNELFTTVRVFNPVTLKSEDHDINELSPRMIKYLKRQGPHPAFSPELFDEYS